MEIVNTIGTWGIKAFAFAGMLLIGYMYLKKIAKQDKPTQPSKEKEEDLHIKI